MTLSPQVRDDLLRRLRRIEGQTKGIQKMLTEGRNCREVLHQLASVRAATQSVSIALAKQYAMSCLMEPDDQDPASSMGDMIEFILRLPQ